MPRTVTMVGWTEFLFHAEELGYNWNTAHDILVSDGIPPMYEIHTKDYYKTDFISNSEEYSEDTIKIILSFMEENNLEKMTVVDE